MGKTKVQLNAEDKHYLNKYVSKGKHSARAIHRARILLMLDEGVSNQKQIAHACNCSEGTITNVLKRYQECRGRVNEVLQEKPRSGQPTIITPELEANITALACCSEGPEGRSTWTLDSIADKMVTDGLAVHLCHETVRKVLKKAGSNPGSKNSGVSLK